MYFSKKIYGFLGLMSLFALSSCGNPAQEALEKEIADVNAHTPCEVENLGNITNVEYIKDSQTTDIEFSVADDLASYIIGNNNQEILTNEFRLISMDPALESLFNAIIHAKSGLELKFTAADNSSVSLNLSNAELAAFKEDYLSESQVNLLVIHNLVAIMNSRCPQPSAFEGVMINKVAEEDNNVNFYYEANENVTSFSNLEKQQNELREHFRRFFRENREDPNQKQLFQRMLDANLNMNFIFYNNKNDNKFNIEFSPQELYALGLK